MHSSSTLNIVLKKETRLQGNGHQTMEGNNPSKREEVNE